jgi:hypothetical protein
MGGPRYSFMRLAYFGAWSLLIRMCERMAPTGVIAPLRPPPRPMGNERLQWN